MGQTVNMSPDPRGGWVVRTSGAAGDAGHFQSRGEAERFGRELCRTMNADFEIVQMDGTVTREHTRRTRPERRS